MDPSGAAAGLTPRMPGSWPLEPPGTAPSLSITLHNPRPVTDAGDVAVDRVRKQTRTSSTTSSAGSSFALSRLGTYSLTSGNVRLLTLQAPLAAQQPHTHSSGGNTSAADFGRMRIGNTSEPDDRRGMRSYEALVDTVITVNGPQGTRYVTGSATVRLWERDVLGFGVTPARPGPRIYDLPAMLADQDADDLRDWARHPVTELPEVLADGIDEQDGAAQLWLALGDDPNGARLARALYAASKTAALSGKPVELVVRTDEDLRRWPFTADGTLADATQATDAAWRQVRDAIDTHGRAVASEATGGHLEAGLLRRRPGARRALVTASAALDTAAAVHRTAERDHGDAVRYGKAAQAALAGVRSGIREAEQELGRVESAARDAQRRYDTAAETERQASEQWQTAQAEVERLEALIAASPATGTAETSRHHEELAEARERAYTARQGAADIGRQRQQYLEAVNDARKKADEIRTDLDAARERAQILDGDFERVKGAAIQARERREQAAEELTRRTNAHDAIQGELRDIEQELNDVQQRLAAVVRRRTNAWNGLQGLVAALDAGRRAEGAGEGPSLLSSLSSAPARPLRPGRFGRLPLLP